MCFSEWNRSYQAGQTVTIVANIGLVHHNQSRLKRHSLLEGSLVKDLHVLEYYVAHPLFSGDSNSLYRKREMAWKHEREEIGEECLSMLFSTLLPHLPLPFPIQGAGSAEASRLIELNVFCCYLWEPSHLNLSCLNEKDVSIPLIWLIKETVAKREDKENRGNSTW